MRALKCLRFVALPVVASLGCLGCARLPRENGSLIDEPRLIAVSAEPPEARPGQEVAYRIVAVGPSGSLDQLPFAASYCESPKPLTESNSVSRACLSEAGAALEVSGSIAFGSVPDGACSLFGPEPPPGDFRPRDPDATGGFFAPVRFDALGRSSVFLQRIRCAPANVAADVAREFLGRYVPNQNPAAPTLRIEASPELGASIIIVSLPEASLESYVSIDPETRRIITQREDLVAMFYVNSGGLEAESATLTMIAGEASASTRLVHDFTRSVDVWVVVRDSRGGVAVAEARIEAP